MSKELYIRQIDDMLSRCDIVLVKAFYGVMVNMTRSAQDNDGRTKENYHRTFKKGNRRACTKGNT